MNAENSLQWLRKCNLFLTDKQGAGFDISNLRIVFSIKKSDAEKPNEATIKIYNLSRETANQITKEFTSITLQAGYEQNFGVIFQGTAIQATRGADNQVDSFLEILSGDGDVPYSFAIVNKTLAAGATQKDVIDTAAGAMAVRTSTVQADTSTKLPRGKVMYGAARKFARGAAADSGASWSIQNGVMQVVRTDSVLPGQGVLLNSDSGLIGVPEQNDKGVVIKSLINPLVKVGASISIAESRVQIAKPATAAKEKKDKKELGPIASDGNYKVLSIDYEGDTHGQNWYQIMQCVALNESKKVAKGADA